MFARMLDPTMTYSCAFFSESDMSLEEAQIAKLERVCQKLGFRIKQDLSDAVVRAVLDL